MRCEKTLEGVPNHTMSEAKEPKSHVSGAYKQAREAFEGLKVEEKAIFLIEASVHTVARGVEEGFRALATEVNSWFDHEEEDEEGAKAEETTDSAEPAEEAPASEEVTEEPAPEPPKKTTKRSTSRRSTSSRRTTKKKDDSDSTDGDAKA